MEQSTLAHTHRLCATQCRPHARADTPLSRCLLCSSTMPGHRLACQSLQSCTTLQSSQSRVWPRRQLRREEHAACLHRCAAAGRVRDTPAACCARSSRTRANAMLSAHPCTHTGAKPSTDANSLLLKQQRPHSQSVLEASAAVAPGTSSRCAAMRTATD